VKIESASEANGESTIQLLDYTDSFSMTALADALFKFGAKATTTYPAIGKSDASWQLALPSGDIVSLQYEIDRGSRVVFRSSPQSFEALSRYLANAPTPSPWRTPILAALLDDMQGIPDRPWWSRLFRRWRSGQRAV